MSRVFANGSRNRGSIPVRVIPKTQNDADLLNTQNYKIRIKGKVEQSGNIEALSSPLRCSNY